MSKKTTRAEMGRKAVPESRILVRCGDRAVRQAVRASAEGLTGEPTALARTVRSVEPSVVVLPPAPRTSGCPRYVRRRIAARLPELCEALMDRAVAGDLNATKLLWQMAELDKPAGAATGSGKTKTAVGFAQKALAEFRAR